LRFALHTDGDTRTVNLAFLGRHNVGNAVAAAACCLAAGESLDSVVAGLEAARPYKGRLQSRRGAKGCLVIDDSYNANPASVRMAIQALLGCDGEKILVLGDMAELGADTQAMHADMGRYAKEAGITALLATGEKSSATIDGFGAGGRHFDNWQSLADYCLTQATGHTVFLVKGSRSAGMDRVADRLVGTGEASC
jgi:UDP-N-acetylmuramyl pentapeptide synthase